MKDFDAAMFSCSFSTILMSERHSYLMKDFYPEDPLQTISLAFVLSFLFFPIEKQAKK